MAVSLCSGGPISHPAPRLWPRIAVDDNPKPWVHASTWENWIKFLAPGFSLVHSWISWTLREWSKGWRLLSLSCFQNKTWFENIKHSHISLQLNTCYWNFFLFWNVLFLISQLLKSMKKSQSTILALSSNKSFYNFRRLQPRYISSGQGHHAAYTMNAETWDYHFQCAFHNTLHYESIKKWNERLKCLFKKYPWQGTLGHSAFPAWNFAANMKKE